MILLWAVRCPVCGTVPCDSWEQADKRAETHTRVTRHPTVTVIQPRDKDNNSPDLHLQDSLKSGGPSAFPGRTGRANVPTGAAKPARTRRRSSGGRTLDHGPSSRSASCTDDSWGVCHAHSTAEQPEADSPAHQRHRAARLLS